MNSEFVLPQSMQAEVHASELLSELYLHVIAAQSLLAMLEHQLDSPTVLKSGAVLATTAAVQELSTRRLTRFPTLQEQDQLRKDLAFTVLTLRAMIVPKQS